jgi:hypothetical protein
MSDQESTQETQDLPAVEVEEHTSTGAGQSPLDAHRAAGDGDDPLPLMGAAFVGGLVLARILKKLGGGDN